MDFSLSFQLSFHSLTVYISLTLLNVKMLGIPYFILDEREKRELERAGQMVEAAHESKPVWLGKCLKIYASYFTSLEGGLCGLPGVAQQGPTFPSCQLSILYPFSHRDKGREKWCPGGLLQETGALQADCAFPAFLIPNLCDPGALETSYWVHFLPDIIRYQRELSLASNPAESLLIQPVTPVPQGYQQFTKWVSPNQSMK